MTADQRLVCRRCGFLNVEGDQFCGSCGAFLEWEGESVSPAGTAPAGAAAGETRDPDVPPVRATGLDAAAGVGGTAVDGPGPGVDDATVAMPATGASAGGGLIRCPACGTANTPNRTFCQSCGAKLAEAARVAPVSDEQLRAAVAAKPVPVTTTVIRGQPSQAAPRSGGGIGKWLVLIAVVGILVGAGAVVGTQLLKPQDPGSEATSAPGATGSAASPGASAGPAATGEAGSSAQPSDAASAPPATPGPLVMAGATASSTVGDLPKFAPPKAIDGDPATSWQEGKAQEKGQWIEVSFGPARVTGVVLTNGYNASKALYKGNRRLKDVRISVDGGKPVTVRLKDTGKPQTFKLKAVDGATTLRITILSTYAASKTSVSGTPFDDAALAEISVLGVPVP